MEETTTETTPATEAKEQFVIDSREKAEWYLRKLANLDREEASIKAQAEAMLRRLRSDRESLQGRYQGQFESFVRGELERSKSKRRSVLFFNGTAQFTSVAPRLTVESLPDAITTARAVAPAAVTEETPEPVVKLDKAAFLKHAAAHFEETGELLPGVGRTEASERFAIKFSEEKGAEGAGEKKGEIAGEESND